MIVESEPVVLADSQVIHICRSKGPPGARYDFKRDTARAMSQENVEMTPLHTGKRMKGLEPSTFCMASRRSSQLSYIRATRPV